MRRQRAIPSALGLLGTLVGLVMVDGLRELLGWVAAGIVLFVIVVAVGSAGLIRSERQRKVRRKSRR
jgi:hypothetical protein